MIKKLDRAEEPELQRKIRKGIGIVGGVIAALTFVSGLYVMIGLSLNTIGLLILALIVPAEILLSYLTAISIEVETVYEFPDYINLDENTELMREQLRIVKTNDRIMQKEMNVSSSKYSYSFDNNYMDNTYDDEIIDDIEIDEFKMVSGIGLKNGFTRRKNRYVGKYEKK